MNFKLFRRCTSKAVVLSCWIGLLLVWLPHEKLHAQSCSYTIFPLKETFPANGGFGSVTVTTQPGCAWTATTDDSWITVTRGSGAGTGTVTYSVAPNPGPNPRLGLIDIAGRPFAVDQEPSQPFCDANVCAIAPTSEDFPTIGGRGTISVTAPGNRRWEAVNHDTWITIASGRTGVGNGTVIYDVGANNSASPNRVGTISIAGHTFRVMQGCLQNIGLDQTITAVLASGNCQSRVKGSSYYANRYAFSAAAGQQVEILLTAANFDTYLYLIGPDGEVIAEDNNGGGGTNSRIPAGSGSLSLPSSGTYVVEVTSNSQLVTGLYNLHLNSPLSCTYSISPTSQSFSENGGTGSVTVTTLSGCNWTAASNVTWLTVTSGSTGNGSGVVDYSVAANTSSISRTGTLTVAGQTFTVMQSPAIARVVRIVNSTASPGSTVSVPIELVAQGDENALGFSLAYNTAILSNPQGTLGRDASGASLITNTSQTSAGRYGIAVGLPTGQQFAAGTREIVVVSFAVSSSASAGSTSIDFSDQPVGREVVDVNAGTLPVTWTPGTVTITSGYEADVAPRPSGNNNGTVTIADWVQVGRFAAGLDVAATSGNEFQRADCAPRPCGDGRISISDWVQAGRYAGGLEPPAAACGPASSSSARIGAKHGSAKLELKATTARTLRVLNTAFDSGKSNSIAVELEAEGNENALGFSLNFDRNLLAFEKAELATGATGASLNPNTNQKDNGRIGIALALPAGQVFAAGVRTILSLSFIAANVTAEAASQITFGDQPIGRETVDVSANSLPTAYTPAAVTIKPPILPVELARFEATPGENGVVHLNWETASETNNFGFQVQRRFGQAEFQTIGFVAGSGATTMRRQYQFVDRPESGAAIQYRLRQMDVDGTSAFSAILTVALAPPAKFSLSPNYPNPVLLTATSTPVVKFDFALPAEAEVTGKIFDLNGRLIETAVARQYRVGWHSVEWKVPAATANGIYFFQLEAAGQRLVQKFYLMK